MPDNPINPSKAPKGALLRWLNSNRAGIVLTPAVIRRHFDLGGGHIAADASMNTINIFRYIGWLFPRWQKKQKIKGEIFTRRNDKSLLWHKEASEEAREISPIPDCQNPSRVEYCREDLQRFMKEYFPAAFYLDFSPAHQRVISVMQRSILSGGKFVCAMPRGSGKTTMSIAAIIWAMLYGHRKFVVLVAAADRQSDKILSNIVAALANNAQLLADFPAACYPLKKLGNIKHRMAGQLYQGQPTFMAWTQSEFTLATIPGAASSGVTLTAVGMTGAIRGMSRARADGAIMRPDFVLVDDPQTAESAKSAEQCKDRLQILNSDILELGGPDQTIACVTTVTVIAPGDAADQLLSPELFPAWNKERTRLLEEFPKNMDLWKDYWDLYVESFRTEHNFARATEFYAEHRAEMDAGAVVTWPERFKDGEISGLQFAMDLYFEKLETFQSEYQNEPLKNADENIEQITVDALNAKLNRLKHGVVPLHYDTLTLFIDVQKRMLFYMVCAFSDTFAAHVLDYGAYPKQKNRIFSALDTGATFTDMYPGMSEPAAMQTAIRDLTGALFRQDFTREDGAVVRISRALVDSGWNAEIVKAACTDNDFAANLLPSRGIGLGPAQKPISEYKRNVGDRIGYNWYVRKSQGTRAGKFCAYDTNYWKSHVRRAIFAAKGDPDSLTFYGEKQWVHEMLWSHLTAEKYVPTAGKGRIVDMWNCPAHRENHWFDCLIGCYVAASMAGIGRETGAKITPVYHNSPAPSLSTVAKLTATVPTPAASSVLNGRIGLKGTIGLRH